MADLINPLVAQYLSGLGSDLMKYGANTNNGLQLENVNAITNQSIKSNNMMKLLQSALGPDGSSVNIDNRGVTLKATNDSELFKQMLDGSGIKTPNATMDESGNLVPKVNASSGPAVPLSNESPASAPVTTTAPTTPSGIINPFGITPPPITGMPKISVADLAGLNPTDIMSVVDAKAKQDQLKQMSYKELVDTMYKGGSLAVDVPYKKALTTQANAAAAENTPSVPIVVGGKTMTVTPKDAIAWAKVDKETKDAKVKQFEYAVSKGYTGDFVKFLNTETTTDIKNFDKAVAGGYKGTFDNWMLTHERARAISLGEKVEEKKTMAGLGGQLYFKDPKWTSDLDKHIQTFKEKELWNVKDEKDRPMALAKENVKFIEGKIIGGGGNIQNVAMEADGKTMAWTVKWPSGDTETIKRPIK